MEVNVTKSYADTKHVATTGGEQIFVSFFFILLSLFKTLKPKFIMVHLIFRITNSLQILIRIKHEIMKKQ